MTITNACETDQGRYKTTKEVLISDGDAFDNDIV